MCLSQGLPGLGGPAFVHRGPTLQCRLHEPDAGPVNQSARPTTEGEAVPKHPGDAGSDGRGPLS